jgi:predicted permease
MAGIAADFQSALRGLLRSRSLFVLAVLCLALGIGASASMLDLLDTLLFRPPAHVASPEALRRVYFHDSAPGFGEYTNFVTSYPVLQDLEKVKAFSGIGAFRYAEVSLGHGPGAREAPAVMATPGLLRMLGVRPVRGRLFSEAEGRPGNPGLVALLGHDLWLREYGGSDVLGRQIAIGPDRYTIIGVLPSRFTGVDFQSLDLWLPVSAAGRILGPEWASRDWHFLKLVVRLRPETAAAEEEATATYRAGLAEAGEPVPAARVSLGPLRVGRGPQAPATVRITAWLTGISWIVLLIACANVASLLLLRGLDRRRELALRLAFGASSGRLAQLMLCEGIVLAVAGGAAALLVFLGASSVFQGWILPQAVRPVPELNPRILAILAVLTAVAALLSGVVPAFWVRRSRLFEGIREGARESGPARSRLNAALSAAQIALAFVLLACAGGFLRSLHNALRLDLGLDTGRVLVARVDLENEGYPAARINEVFHQSAERVRRLPGVESASVATTIPFAASGVLSLSVPGVEEIPGSAYINPVGEDFFRTTGTSVLRGRELDARDRKGSVPVAVVNQTMARLLWPGGGALGRCLQVGGEGKPCSTVVGVVEDARRSELQEEPTMQYYIPLGQDPRENPVQALFVRSAVDAESLIPAVRREMQAVVPNLPFVDVQLMASYLDPDLRPWRMGATVLTVLGVLALALAVVGLYGVIAHSMTRRTYELSVRAALGAEWRDVLWLAVRQGLRIGVAGAVAGLALTLVAARYLQPLLFQVSAADPLSLAGAAGIVLILALLSSYASTRRVRRIDPAAALRTE